MKQPERHAQSGEPRDHAAIARATAALGRSRATIYPALQHCRIAATCGGIQAT
jgi:hypothetical protein